MKCKQSHWGWVAYFISYDNCYAMSASSSVCVCVYIYIYIYIYIFACLYEYVFMYMSNSIKGIAKQVRVGRKL